MKTNAVAAIINFDGSAVLNNKNVAWADKRPTVIVNFT
jgi:hypothetical protein